MSLHQGWEPKLKLQRSRKLLEGRYRSRNGLWEPGKSPIPSKFCLFYDKHGTSYKMDRVLNVSVGEIVTAPLALGPPCLGPLPLLVLPRLLSLAAPCCSSGESCSLRRRAHCAQTIGPKTSFLSRRKYLQEKNGPAPLPHRGFFPSQEAPTWWSIFRLLKPGPPICLF